MNSMSRRDFLRAVGLGTAALSLGRLARAAEASPRPNVILIMSDDMGYSDIGCYGSEIETPNLDSLAANGLRFTHFYNTARCCPTRASLLTGLYPHQAGVGWMMSNQGAEGYQGSLHRKCVTIAEALRPAGYSTYMVGKWHVTPPASKEHWPLQRGFDRFYGTIHGAGSFFDPNTLTRDNELISPYADPQYKPETFYYTDAISDHAVRFIADHARKNADKPFFMYVAYTAAHWPMHALPKDIAKYKGKYDCGYEPIRKARYEKMKGLGVVEKHWKLSEQAGDWQAVKDKAWEACCMEVYAAMVDNMDQGIGRIVAELKKQARLDNTLILFFQDNGGCAEGFGRGGVGKPRADKPPLPPMDPKALQSGMVPKQSRDGYPTRRGVGAMPGPADTAIGYGKAWANVSNTPFREYKHWVHEGGISTPLIAHWPAGIREKGKLRHTPSHLVDLMATCVDLSGATYPAKVKGNDIRPMEGVSLAGIFNNKPIAPRALFWEHEKNCAIHLGKWKLVAKKGLTRDGVKPEAWELYDMQADRSELNDLASAEPERVKEMARLYDEYARRANVLPLPGPRKSPAKKARDKKKEKA
ncbi:MAG: arylsulfatase [Phycisphaerae bacterium]